MEQVDATVVSERSGGEGDLEFSWSFWHFGEPYFLSSFHRKGQKSSPPLQNGPESHRS